MMDRPDWNTYFLSIAEKIAQRATCPRASVGAVIVKDRRILAAGYNGAAPGEEHCTSAGCQVEGDHCQRAIHAETNAVAQAAKFGLPIDGATLYLWGSNERGSVSCHQCSQVMKAAGIIMIIGRNDG